MAETVHPALEAARDARKRESIIAPSHLWHLAEGNPDLYRHAMREMGAIVPALPDGSPGQPEDPCSTCGWSPSDTGETA